MQTDMVHVRLGLDDIKQLRDLAEKCGHSAPSLAGMMIKAAISAIDGQDRAFLPMKLELSDSRLALNEPSPAYHKRK